MITNDKRIYKVYAPGMKLTYKCITINTSHADIIAQLTNMFSGRKILFKIFCNDEEVGRVNGKHRPIYKRDGKVIDKSTGDLYTFEDFMDMHGYGKSQAYCIIKNSKLYEWQINT